MSSLLAVEHPALLDGAIGSELQRRGATIDPVLWSAIATLTNPELLAAVHRDYINAGCHIITDNTFFSSRNNLCHAGRGNDFHALNSRSIKIARRVSDESQSRPLVAGSISTMPPLDRVSYVDKGSATTRFFAEQIRIMEDEGADLLLLEMLLESDSASCLLEACGRSRLPVWAGLSASRSESTQELIGFRCPGAYGELNDESFERLCESIADFRPHAMGVMHTRPELLGEAFDTLRRVHFGLAFAYPNVGYFRNPSWVFPGDAELELLSRDLVACAARFDLSVIGGCCGTTPAFIRSLDVARGELASH